MNTSIKSLVLVGLLFTGLTSSVIQAKTTYVKKKHIGLISLLWQSIKLGIGASLTSGGLGAILTSPIYLINDLEFDRIPLWGPTQATLGGVMAYVGLLIMRNGVETLHKELNTIGKKIKIEEDDDEENDDDENDEKTKILTMTRS